MHIGHTVYVTLKWHIHRLVNKWAIKHLIVKTHRNVLLSPVSHNSCCSSETCIVLCCVVYSQNDRINENFITCAHLPSCCMKWGCSSVSVSYKKYWFEFTFEWLIWYFWVCQWFLGNWCLDFAFVSIELQMGPKQGMSNCYCRAVYIPPSAEKSPKPRDEGVPKVCDMWGCHYSFSDSKWSLFTLQEKQNCMTWQLIPISKCTSF